MCTPAKGRNPKDIVAKVHVRMLAHHLQQKAEPVFSKENVCLMQRTLFLTSNLSGIWSHKEFRSTKVSNKGHWCPQKAMIKCLAEASACTGFFLPSLSLQHKDWPHWKKNLLSIQCITQLGTDNYISSLWEEIFLLGFVDPFFTYIVWVPVMGGQDFPFPLESAFFRAILKTPARLHSQTRLFYSNLPFFF